MTQLPLKQPPKAYAVLALGQMRLYLHSIRCQATRSRCIQTWRSKKDAEADVYERLQGSDFFPHYYGKGDKYIVISYESGVTLLDCLLQGIPVPEQVILDVEKAREFVRSRGLNPRDIHLKNVLMQDGRAKVLDVSEYVKEGDDKRWEHLVWAYHTFYSGFSEVKVPSWILDTIKKWYYKLDNSSINLEEFAQRASQLFSKWKS